MHAGCICVAMDIFEWKILEGPVIHGSRSMVNGCGLRWSASSGRMGSKDRRKEASELRCFTVNDIADAMPVDSED